MAGHELIRKLRRLEKEIGNTPLARFDVPGCELHAKLEYYNMTGSLKDRPALYALKKGIEDGNVTPDTTIVESSSGNFASALAVMARRLDLKFLPVIDPNINKMYENFLRLSCAEVAKVTVRDAAGGFQKTRIAKVKQLVNTLPDAFWTDQYGNPACMNAHYESTGGEICSQLDSLDYAFIGVSSGGTISGLSRRLKEAYPGVHIVAVDALGSAIFGGEIRARYIPGIGSTTRPALLDHALIDEVVKVAEPDTVRGCLDLFTRQGIFAGGSSGSVYSAVTTYFSRMRTTLAKPRVLMICADRGLAYFDTIYNETWRQWLQTQYAPAFPSYATEVMAHAAT